MATEFLREKINTLNAMVQQFSLEQYQNSLLIRDAEETTGDAAVDHQMATMAENAKVVVAMMQRRRDVRKQELDTLQTELRDSQ
jgi:hypothetical protein